MLRHPSSSLSSPSSSSSLWRLSLAAGVCLLIWLTTRVQNQMSSKVVYSEGSPDWDPVACIPYVANISASWTHQHGDISLADIEAGLDQFSGQLPPQQELPYYPLWDKDVSINDVLGYWNDSTPKTGQWRHPFHILWVDGQTNKNCPTCRLCMHKLQVLVKSFLATQDLSRCSLIVHTDDVAGLKASEELEPLLPYFQLVPFDMHAIALDTEFEGQWVLDVVDSKAYLTGDLFRMLVLYRFGGIYVDFDSILFSDFGPLLGKEFWARWECTTDMSPGIMSLNKNGELATLVFRQLTQTKPEADTYQWGTDLITRIYYDLGPDHPVLKDLFVAPACYFYPEWCTQSQGPYFSEKSRNKPLFLGGFAYHWHGGGGKRFELNVGHGSQFDRTEQIIDEKLKIRFGWDAAKTLTTPTLDKYAPPPTCKRYDHPTNWMSPKYTRWLRLPFGLIIFALFVQFCLSRHHQQRVKDLVKQFFVAVFETLLSVWMFFLAIVRFILSIGTALWILLKTTWSKQSGRACILLVIGIPALYGIWRITRPPDCGFGRSDGGYSIAMYNGASLRGLEPLSPNVPVLTAGDVTDRSGVEWLADPFLVVEHEDSGMGRYHMFFEAISYWGEIGHATSRDGKDWTYQSIVLSEPGFHLSFPFVFQYNGEYYMMPETGAKREVRLYRAVEFPSVWIYQGTLFHGNYIDSTMFEYGSRWWLFLWENQGSNVGSLSIYYTERDDSPVEAQSWKPHARNPVLEDSYLRPAGRPVVSSEERKDGNILYRFVMDNTRTYGERVYVMQIDKLTPTEFKETMLNPNGPPAKFLRGTGSGWNAHNMHHVDAHRLSTGQWIASVDGCGHPPYSASKSSLRAFSASPVAAAPASRVTTFSTMSLPSSTHAAQTDVSTTVKGVSVAAGVPSVSYSISSGHVPLAVRPDGLVVIIAVTQVQFFALTYLLDALRLAHAQVIVYDMGLSSDQVGDIVSWQLLTYRKFDFTRFPSHLSHDGVKAWKPVIIAEVMEEIHHTHSSNANTDKQSTMINVLWIEAGGLIANIDDAMKALRAAPYGLLVGATPDTIGHHSENAVLLKYFDDTSNFGSQAVVDSAIIGISVPYTHMIEPTASRQQSQQTSGVSMIAAKKRQSALTSPATSHNVWRDIIVEWRSCALSSACMVSSTSHKPDQVVLSYLLYRHNYVVSKIDSANGVHQQCDRAFYHSLSSVFDSWTLPPAIFQYWCLA